MPKKIDPKDKPYVENYPPLKAWLDKHDARCNWQQPLGNYHNPNVYIESWIIRGDGGGGGEVIVIIRGNQQGWNMYTAERGNDISTAFADAEKRLGLQ